MKYFDLNNGEKFPAIGYGCFKLTNEDEIRRSLISCYENGYTLLDTAYYYDNEEIIGKILEEENLNGKFSICTKVWPKDFGRENTKKSIERSLKNLRVDKLDVMYLHWPSKDFAESWKVLEDYYEQGLIKTIAICNFYKNHLDELLKDAKVIPAINQIETHPLLSLETEISYIKSLNIHPLAWSPIGRADKELFENKDLIGLSEKYNKSLAQIVLKWNIQRGVSVIPKSANPKRIAENINLFDFELSHEDMDLISSLNKNKHVSKSPLDEKWLNDIR